MIDFDPAQYLAKVSASADADIDLVATALALAAMQEKTGPVMDRYFNHLRKIANEVAERFAELSMLGDESIEARVAALKHILADKYGYTGDRERYDDLQNASLIRVIDRGKGMPITLGILYIQAGRAQGWQLAGLDVPGHFVCRIEHAGRRVIFDPFEDCKILGAPELRALVKRAEGLHAELTARHLEPATNRQILLRLQNNIKYRQIESEDYKGALQTVELMRLVDPGEYRLLLDAGVLYARNHQPRAAIDVLEDYIKKAPNDRDRHDAALLLRELKESLH